MATPVNRPPPPQLIDTETKALFALGFIKPVDFVFAGVILLGTLVTACWMIFATPEAAKIAVVLLIWLLLLAVWLLMLVYRAIYFILMVTAAMELLPENAARIVYNFLRQVGPVPAPKGPPQPITEAEIHRPI